MLKQMVMGILRTKLNDSQMKQFSQKFDEVSQVVQMAKNPQEALQKFGVTSEDLQGAKGLLNNSFVKKGLKTVGISEDKAGSIIDGLSTTQSRPVETAPTGDLDALQKSLAQLKK